MTYGERLQMAMDYAKVDQPKIVALVSDLRKKDGLSTKISQQTVSKALRSAKSSYTSWFARALGVSSLWLESEIGERVVMRIDSITQWPFSFDEIRFLRLPANKKKFIERTMIAMIEGFEAEAADALPPKKTTKKRK
jgi:hypothetical protein